MCFTTRYWDLESRACDWLVYGCLLQIYVLLPHNTVEDFPGSTVVKNPPTSERGTRDMGSISGSGKSPGEGNGNPLQYSCLENPKDRGAWWATVHVIPKSRTWLSVCVHTYTHKIEVFSEAPPQGRRQGSLSMLPWAGTEALRCSTRAVPNLFGTRTQYHRRQSFHTLGDEGKGVDGLGVIQAHYIHYAL